ncbi:MAG: IS200/IS605 family transposase [Chloroflexi bacterium]|nr:IS200/IS605 family transposase [Chloroflexota bacterium]
MNGRVHLLKFHLVWTPKRCKPGLVGEVAKDCRMIIEAKCEVKGWIIKELAIQPEHSHLFIQVWPANSVSGVVKEIKGITAFELRKKNVHLKKLPSMWTRAYFSATVGNGSAQTIEKYIAAQKGL